MRAQEIIRDLIDKLEAIDAKLSGNSRDPGEVAPCDAPEEEDQAVFVPPLQQSLELKKAALGKNSAVADSILDDADEDGPIGEM